MTKESIQNAIHTAYLKNYSTLLSNFLTLLYLLKPLFQRVSTLFEPIFSLTFFLIYQIYTHDELPVH